MADLRDTPKPYPDPKVEEGKGGVEQISQKTE